MSKPETYYLDGSTEMLLRAHVPCVVEIVTKPTGVALTAELLDLHERLTVTERKLRHYEDLVRAYELKNMTEEDDD